MDLHSPIDYWDKVATQKRFNHQPARDWIAQLVQPDEPILDYGCGYGRLIREFREMGYRQIQGWDPSPSMVRRGIAEMDLAEGDFLPPTKLPNPQGAYAMVLLFAVLTCVPFTEKQMEMLQTIRGILRPGGILYLSDLLLQDDDRNRARYQESKDKFDSYGIFRHPEGVLFRHHRREYLRDELLSGFEIVREKPYPVRSMNGNPLQGIQIAAKCL